MCRGVCVRGGGGGDMVQVSAHVLVLVHVCVQSVGPEAWFWSAFAFGGQLPENPGVCLWSYPGSSEVFLVSLLLF